MVHVVDERGWTMEGGVKVSCMILTYVPIVEFFLTLILICGGWHQNLYNTIAVKTAIFGRLESPRLAMCLDKKARDAGGGFIVQLSKFLWKESYLDKTKHY